MISHEQKLEYLEFASRVLGNKFQPELARTAWITRLNEDGSVSAVVVFTNFTEFNCEMSIATDEKSIWATRDFMGVCYRYAFNQMKLRRITVVISADNTRSIRMCKKIGHVEEGLLKHWYGDQDGIVMRMLREECKWIEV